MAKFELNIYGKNDEIINKYETDHIRYGIMMKAMELRDKSDETPMAEQLASANALVKEVFQGLTDDELMLADVGDVLNIITQITKQTEKIGNGSNASKN